MLEIRHKNIQICTAKLMHMCLILLKPGTLEKKNIVQIVKKFTIKFKILLFSSITGQIKPLAIV